MSARSTRRHHPAQTLAVFLLTAIATGPGALTGALAYQFLFQPLPFEDAGRLIAISEAQGAQDSAVSPLSCARWSTQNRTLSALGCYYAGGGTALSHHDQHSWIQTAILTPGVLKALAVRPSAGRVFAEHEDDPVVLISERLSRRLFADGAPLVGDILQLGGRAVEIVGVVPGLDAVLPGVDVFLPWSLDRHIGRRERGTRYFRALARLAPAAMLEQAGADLARVQAVLASEFPDTHAGWRTGVQPLKTALTRNSRSLVLAATAFAGLLTFAASLNLGFISLAGLASQQLDSAVRVALGATAGRLLLEAIAGRLRPAAAGALAGASSATLLTRPLLDALGLGESAAPHVGLLSAIAVVLALLSLAVPAVMSVAAAARQAPANVLRGLPSGGSLSPLRWIAGAEVAASLVLSALTFALLSDFRALSLVDPHIRAEGLVLVDVRWPLFSRDRATLAPLLRERLSRLGRTDLCSVALDETPATVAFTIGHEDRRVTAGYVRVTSGYFQTVGVPLLEGRPFADDDEAPNRPAVAVVSRSVARAAAVNGGILGKRLTLEVPPVVAEVVGVVEDVVDPTDPNPPQPRVYLPLSHDPPPRVTVYIREPPQRRISAQAVRDEAGRLGGDVIVTRVLRAGEVLARRLERPVALLESAGLATAICLALTVSGCVALAVLLLRRHDRDIAIRLALGSTRSRTLAWAAGQQLRWGGAGLVLGGLLAGAAIRGLESLPWPHAFAWSGTIVSAVLATAVPTGIALLVVLSRQGQPNLAELLRAG